MRVLRLSAVLCVLSVLVSAAPARAAGFNLYLDTTVGGGRLNCWQPLGL